MIILIYLIAGWFRECFCETGGLAPAARIADKHCGLSDRLLTAVSILQKEQKTLTAMECLQIEDAAAAAKTVVPQNVALPPVITKRFWKSMLIQVPLLLSIYCIYCLVVRLSPVSVAEENVLPPESISEVDEVRSIDGTSFNKMMLEKMRQIAAQQKTPSRANPEGTRENKLSSVSEMNEAVRNSLQRWDTAAKIASMNDIADAFNAAEATKKAADALKDKRYSDAAHELNQMNSDLISTMPKQERKEVAEMLKEAIQKTKDRGQKPLAETLEKIENVMNDGAVKTGAAEGFGELAEESRKLAMQQMLEKSKENQPMNENMPLNFTEGSGDGGKKADKSQQEGKNWGTGEAGDPASGQATELKNEKQRQELSGIIGEDNLEGEKTQSRNTAPKNTEREYQDLHYTAEKVPEEVLNKEPLPLEQRQTLRRYFELLQQERN